MLKKTNHSTKSTRVCEMMGGGGGGHFTKSTRVCEMMKKKHTSLRLQECVK